MNAKSKIALVTGAAGQTGSNAVKRLQQDGFFTVGIDLKESAADLNIICDVTDREAMKAAVAKIEAEQGGIDVLFIAAGATLNGRFEDVSMEEWQSLLDVWLRGTLNACAAVGPYMVERKYGRIIALSADYAKTDRGYMLDAAAASSVHGFIKSFACEVAPHQVIANVLFPSVPFDQEAIAASVSFLASDKYYIVGQALPLHGLN